MKRFAIGAILSTVAAPATAAPLYSNNFDGAVVVGSGVIVTPLTNGGLETASVGAWNGDGWAGNYFANRSAGNPALTSLLSLSNLAPHTTVSVKFLLGFLESWDSSDGSCCAPDYLDILIDGTPVIVGLTTNNALGNVEFYGGGTELYDGPNINFVAHFNTADTLVDMGTAGALSFAHSGSTLTFGIRAYGGGWQGGGDEGWGIDSLSLTYDGRVGGVVPEPESWALMIAGLGLAGAALRSRRRSAAVA